MTEEELIEEGFERIDILIEESGDKNDYHYYIFSFGNGFTLYSSENIPNLELGWDRYEKVLDKISEKEGKLKEFAIDTIQQEFQRI